MVTVFACNHADTDISFCINTCKHSTHNMCLPAYVYIQSHTFAHSILGPMATSQPAVLRKAALPWSHTHGYIANISAANEYCSNHTISLRQKIAFIRHICTIEHYLYPCDALLSRSLPQTLKHYTSHQQTPLGHVTGPCTRITCMP